MDHPSQHSTGRHARRGTDLVVGAGERRVRVLDLPRVCSNRMLIGLWADRFGHGGSPMVWVPWGDDD
jgi:hypothetical protein